MLLVCKFTGENSFSTEVRVLSSNEMLMSKYHYLIEEKLGWSRIRAGKQPGRALLISANDKTTGWLRYTLRNTGLMEPQGQVSTGIYPRAAGDSCHHLCRSTRMPTEEMLRDIDVLLFDMRISTRTYTYMST